MKRSDGVAEEALCVRCGAPLVGKTVRARFCSDGCRNAFHNASRRIQRDHARTVGHGLRELTAVVDGIEQQPFVDPDAITETVSKNFAAVMNQPTASSVRAHLTRIEADYQAAVATDRIRHERELAELREKLTLIVGQRDDLVAERDALTARVDALDEQVASLRAVDHLATQLDSLRDLVLGERRSRASRCARPTGTAGHRVAGGARR